ncbi:WD repeat-containing protein 89 [Orussus abietinus]|uniref:WD repeat-containing protein 89 n=1 Tax=Orussus abietinus TaxID=222816 RepID=UPI000624F679|nr:WD repeat-containing protein 89 [Orussus abietinus]
MNQANDYVSNLKTYYVLAVLHEEAIHDHQCTHVFCVVRLSFPTPLECPYKKHIKLKETVSFDENYVLSVCGTQSDPDFRIGAALSDCSCIVYSIGESLSKTAVLSHADSPVVGIKFSPTSRNILYTATNKGQVSACDMRAKGKIVAEFKDNTEDGKLKPLASFDISSNERLIAGGTEHIGGDAFILFWDIRYINSKLDGRNSLLGGYWESHMDDVTCLAFHSSKQDVLMSGSTDGLINIFDLTQTSEDSALTYSLNTESSVDRLGWLTDESLWCTTHTHSLQLWECDGATPYVKFDRQCLAMLQNEDPDNCYLVRMHVTDTGAQPLVLTGSSSIKGENLRCVNVVKDQLKTCYDIAENKQIVRDSWLHQKSGSLVTGGENGIINIWRQSEMATLQQNPSHKLLAKIGGKSREKQHRPKPY